ncbi:Nucleoside-diphosphate-sugar epimerase [Sphingomonas guangdongensis]|uniref:Nucleoside-diphosphate-sugar epimerase n=1 Tax=Sphingomonas guangdongensis TaxID=1141890 RepID=A0A285QCM3_9SPHN|nr:NAD(P)-dependent oxidoreductase [Sphingomonas guangdongensis]SOB79633.1 Nucleoside-diphosphate-sugar epimerase [Sphingomonas guangdongensis]
MHLLIFGLGYAASAIARQFAAAGWTIESTGRAGTLAFDDDAAVRAAVGRASNILSSVPPADDRDPVLDRYGDVLGGRWLGYLSSTGVYGDAGGAWVDETAPIRGRRAGRNAADAAWLARGARVLRLPGIYGHGRSPLDRVAAGTAHRTGLRDQVFSRVHVDDIAHGVAAAIDGPAGAFNLADDLPASQDDVVDYAAALLGVPPPPIVALDTLSPAAQAFYGENRRVSNRKAARVLGWRPRYPDYRFGLRAVSAVTSPPITSSAPAAASGDQR